MPAILLAHYEVTDRERFIEVFDGFAPARAQAGATARGLRTAADDPGAFVAVLEFPSRAEAEAFASSPERRAALERATVTDLADEITDVVRPFGAGA